MGTFSLSQLDQLIADFPFLIKPTTKPTIAISACLNGEVVRYDGQQKSLDTKTILNRYLQLNNICPEVGAGMSVPRPAIQLMQASDNNSDQHLQLAENIKIVERDNHQRDVSATLKDFSETSLLQLNDKTVAYVLKSKSPSCGIHSTPIFNSTGEVIAIGSGVQADYFMRNAPELLFTDETSLISEQQCSSFIFLCFLLHDFFHSPYKLDEKHQHYSFLTHLFSKQQQERLKQLLDQKNSKDYGVCLKTAAQDLIVSKGLAYLT
jgi:uncharacterized protein YbbK (DUF523 family)